MPTVLDPPIEYDSHRDYTATNSTHPAPIEASSYMNGYFDVDEYELNAEAPFLIDGPGGGNVVLMHWSEMSGRVVLLATGVTVRQWDVLRFFTCPLTERAFIAALRDLD